VPPTPPAARSTSRFSARKAALAATTLALMVSTVGLSTDSAANSFTSVNMRTAIRTAHTRMPNHNLKHWKLAFRDDFRGHKLSSAWSVYGPTAVPSNPNTAYWSPSHAKVANSMLTLSGKRDRANGQIVTAGVGLWGEKPLTYGKYKMLVRVTKCSEVKYAWILWPYNGEWPAGGEVDFGEDEGGARQGTTGSIVYDNQGSPGTLRQNYVTTQRPFSDWHVVGVIWKPGVIKYTLDGKTWGVRRSADVPSQPMVLALQTESLVPSNQVPKSFDSCNAQIGWVAEWSLRR
jgi:beta-glucanase (GH16 family)